MADITSIPAARVPVLEPGSNIMSREWYRFLFNQFGQTGSGTTDISISDLSLAPFSGAEAEASMDLVRADVQGLLAAPPTYRPVPRRAAFANSATQTAAASTATAVTFNTTIFTNGVDLASSSQMSPGQAGDYLVNYRVQFDKTSGGDSPAWVWLRKNGTNVANSATTLRLQGNNAEEVAAWNFLLDMNAGDYFELMWEVSDLAVALLADPASAVHPAIPSIILTVTDNISS